MFHPKAQTTGLQILFLCWMFPSKEVAQEKKMILIELGQIQYLVTLLDGSAPVISFREGWWWDRNGDGWKAHCCKEESVIADDCNSNAPTI